MRQYRSSITCLVQFQLQSKVALDTKPEKTWQHHFPSLGSVPSRIPNETQGPKSAWSKPKKMLARMPVKHAAKFYCYSHCASLSVAHKELVLPSVGYLPCNWYLKPMRGMSRKGKLMSVLVADVSMGHHLPGHRTQERSEQTHTGQRQKS